MTLEPSKSVASLSNASECHRDEGIEATSDGELRLRRIRTRFLICIAIAVLCNVLLCMALSQVQSPFLITSWRRVAAVLALLNFVPLLIVEWVNWRMDRRGVSEMWAFGQHNFDQVSHMLVAQRAAAADMRDSKPYIDVIHEQIGGSLTESEHEVTALIEQLNLLTARSSHQMDRITQSVQSGKALTEVTRTRVEGNNQLISKLGEKLGEQDRETHQNFEQIRMLADDVRALTPIIEVITSIAKQTSLLALNVGLKRPVREMPAGALASLPMRSES